MPSFIPSLMFFPVICSIEFEFRLAVEVVADSCGDLGAGPLLEQIVEPPVVVRVATSVLLNGQADISTSVAAEFGCSSFGIAEAEVGRRQGNQRDSSCRGSHLQGQ